MKILNVFLFAFLIINCAHAQNEKKLFDAINKGNTKEVEALLKQGANINARGGDKATPLIHAVNKQDTAMVDLLLKNGADVNAHTGDDYVRRETALMIASWTGNVSIMKKLIEAGADVNAVSGRDQPNMGKPVLRYAIDSRSPEAVRILLESGANANELTNSPLLNVRNIPLLSHAIRKGVSIEIINALIKSGADVNQKAHLVDLTPLMIACKDGYTDAVKALLAAGADPNIKNKQDGDRTALDYAKEPPVFKRVKVPERKEIIELLQKK
jgi:ankyrin repeat protein